MTGFIFLIIFRFVLDHSPVVFWKLIGTQNQIRKDSKGLKSVEKRGHTLFLLEDMYCLTTANQLLTITEVLVWILSPIN